MQVKAVSVKNTALDNRIAEMKMTQEKVWEAESALRKVQMDFRDAEEGIVRELIAEGMIGYLRVDPRILRSMLK